MLDWKSEIRAAMADLRLDPSWLDANSEKLAQHASEHYRELLNRGTAPAQAKRTVLEQIRADHVRVHLDPAIRPAPTQEPSVGDGNGFFSGVGRDFRFAGRLLRKNPLFTIVSILSLALGIGANTAIFRLIDAVVLRTLPVPNPQELVSVDLIHQGRIGSSVSRQHNYSSAMWEQIRQKQVALSAAAAWSTETFDLGAQDDARHANGLWVSGSFFDLLRIKPVLGRAISPSDDQPGCGIQGVMLSYAFWQRNFGGDSRVIGSKLSLNQHPFDIIGVAPQQFTGLEVGRTFDVALPLCSEIAMHPDESWTKGDTTWWLDVIGRLAPGWSLRQASANLAAISPGVFAAIVPPEYDNVARKAYLRFTMRALPFASGVSSLRKAYEEPLWLLLGISGLVLLIACANLVNLVLARATAREREMALRLSLGGSKLLLMRQLLIESFLLACVGAAAGMILAQILTRFLIARISTTADPVTLSLSLDWRVLMFTVALTLLTCVLIGIAPALQSSHAEPATVLRAGGRGLTGGRERFLLRRGLIVSQVAMSLVLLVTALLFVRTFQNLLNTSVGFEPSRVIVADFDLSALKLHVESRPAWKRNLLAQVNAIPGVVAAAQTNIVPLSGSQWNEFINIPEKSIQRLACDFNEVTSSYFHTMQIPVRAGRLFDGSDTLTSPPVAIVNEAFVHRFLGQGNPIGKTFGKIQGGDKPDKIYQVIGLVGNTKEDRIRDEAGPLVYVNPDQDAEPDSDATLVVRASGPIAPILGSLRRTASNISPAIALQVSLLRSDILDSLMRERLMASLSGIYGILAAILTTIGLYGIMSWMVIRRRNEIGVRIALGASRRVILLMVMREAMTMLGVGLVTGVILVFASGHAVQSLLYGLKPTNLLVLFLSMAGMTLITIIASIVPAERAAAVQPMEILREE